ncbi:MAG: hypothetical protein WA734_06035, partial [Candidatus Acidiferrales bacterium]
MRHFYPIIDVVNRRANSDIGKTAVAVLGAACFSRENSLSHAMPFALFDFPIRTFPFRTRTLTKLALAHSPP